jgi:UDP-N-acetylglucosamine/UDP-N-acetylgalactosamine diphosphorylase
MNREQLTSLLAPYGQEHLLAFWDELDDSRRQSLAEEIEAIDFPLVERLFHAKNEAADFRSLADRAGEPPAFRLGDPANRLSPEEACRRGEESLRAGEAAVILVAGGQGTRLGFDHPKGMFPIGPVSGRTIFQIHVEKILAADRRYGRPIPLCLMTSPATHAETVEFFDRHARFGLEVDDLMVFCQGTMPAVDASTGEVLLADRGRLALSPDGHGGMLAALVRSGTLAALRRRGIRHVFYFQVDNPLVDVCSPEFIGYHLLAGSELSSQVVAKTAPLDRVGNVVEVNGHLQVIEYSDLPDDVAARRKPDGSLAIWAGSIAVHVMDLDFLARAADSADALPFHVARKKVTCVDPSGAAMAPREPNAIKFERFIFDLLPWANNAIVVEVDARRNFGPLKNAPGQAEDTPESVKAQMVRLHAEWLGRAGVEVPEGVAVEISPLFALDADELARKLPPGTRIDAPTCFA